MPKLKVLDTRKTKEEVVVMSWSPKMDLLALGNKKGEVHLHRLSWQKVWQVTLALKDGSSSSSDPVIPSMMTWHPEGLFLVVISEGLTYVIDVEGGKIVHNHEVPQTITTARWYSSQYEHSLAESLSAHFRQQLIQRLESNLSILFLGTDEGYVYAYTGGFLLGLRLKILENSSCRTLQVECNSSLQSFFFVCEESVGKKTDGSEVKIVLHHYKNRQLPKMASIIRPLGLRYILFLKNWATVQEKFAGMNEEWAKIVDLYTTYMTYGGTKDVDLAKVEYLELALTGICSAEMEIFLGGAGREKEAKKNINLINSASASITEHVRTTKCSLSNMLTELNEIGGFLRQVSAYPGADDILIETRKSISYLFLAVLNMQGLVHNFVDLCWHFMNLILNTIHSFSVQDIPDSIEEDSNTDKVIEFLQMKVDKNILEYLFTNAKLGFNEKEDRGGLRKRTSNAGIHSVPIPVSRNVFSNITNPEGGVNNYKDFANFIHNVLKKVPDWEEGNHPLLLDYSEQHVKELVTDIVPKINSLTKKLLGIPVLNSIAFQSGSYLITRIPRKIYFNPDSKARNPVNIFFNQSSSTVYLSTLSSTHSILMLGVDVTEDKELTTPVVKSCSLNFSRSICCFDTFSVSHMTVVSYELEERKGDREQDVGKTIVCQVPYASILAPLSGQEVPSTPSKGSKTRGSTSNPLQAQHTVNVDIPSNVSRPFPPEESNLDFVLPIEGFCPVALTVSGPRKVGSILGQDQQTVMILEIESEHTSESTMEEVGEEEEEVAEAEEARNQSTMS